MQRTLVWVAAAVIASYARAECPKVCFADLPCPTVEITGTFEMDRELCAGNLTLHPGATVLLGSSLPALIQVERDLHVDGDASIVWKRLTLPSETTEVKEAPKPKGLSFNRGPDTNGPGSAQNGRHGGHGDTGAPGKDRDHGADAPTLGLAVGRDIVIGNTLLVKIAGENGKNGGDGGDGGPGGDGEQGGRAIPGQPFGCANGPGNGGNGNDGGDGGPGGAGANGGNGGRLEIRIPTARVQAVRSLLGSKIVADVSGGAPGRAGEPGNPGGPGLFGWGGRGATGCEGRVDERKGHSGIAGRKPPPRVPTNGKAGAPGSIDVVPLH